MSGIKKIETPLTDEVIEDLNAGDQVLITGTIYTGRDSAHKRLVEVIESGDELPIPLEGQIIYYVGPAPAKPGQVINSAGPTTSMRMDAYAPELIRLGLAGMIGKGPRNDDVKNAMREYGAIYFAAVGGAAALIAKSITKAEVVAYDDLGPEAIHKLTVEEFPAVVATDAKGNDLYIEGKEKYKVS